MTDRETPAGAVEALAAALDSCEWTCPHESNFSSVPVTHSLLAALTASGYSLTRSVDVERWQRIETAARAYLEAESEPHGSWVLDNESEKARFERDSRLRAALRDALGKG